MCPDPSFSVWSWHNFPISSKVTWIVQLLLASCISFCLSHHTSHSLANLLSLFKTHSESEYYPWLPLLPLRSVHCQLSLGRLQYPLTQFPCWHTSFSLQGTVHSQHGASVILLKCMSDHVTPLLKTVQWPPSPRKKPTRPYMIGPHHSSCHLHVYSTQDTAPSLLCFENPEHLPASGPLHLLLPLGEKFFPHSLHAHAQMSEAQWDSPWPHYLKSRPYIFSNCFNFSLQHSPPSNIHILLTYYAFFLPFIIKAPWEHGILFCVLLCDSACRSTWYLGNTQKIFVEKWIVFINYVNLRFHGFIFSYLL